MARMRRSARRPSRMSAPRMSAPRMSAPRMSAPRPSRMSAPSPSRMSPGKPKKKAMMLKKIKMLITMLTKDGDASKMDIKAIVKKSMGSLKPVKIRMLIKSIGSDKRKMLMTRPKDGDKDNKKKGKGKGNKGLPPLNKPPKVETEDKDSKFYKKFDYDKENQKASNRQFKKDRRQRENYEGPEKLINNDRKRKLIAMFAMMVGNDQSRVGSGGRLKLKMTQMVAKPPDLMKLNMQLKNIRSPYSNLISDVGNATGIGSGKGSRQTRTRMRLSDLSTKLSSGSSIGTSKTSGYGDKGSDLIKKYSKYNGAS